MYTYDTNYAARDSSSWVYHQRIDDLTELILMSLPNVVKHPRDCDNKLQGWI